MSRRGPAFVQLNDRLTSEILEGGPGAPPGAGSAMEAHRCR
jgi:hypothetical protein